MLVTAIAPEILISKNMGDLAAVKFDIKRLQELASEDGVPWTRTHSLFANMGGFVIRSHVPERFVGLIDAKAGPDTPELEHESSRIPDGAESESMERVGSAFNGGRNLSSNGKDTSKVESQAIATAPYHSDPYHLLARDILALREANLLPHLPYILKSELNDKSKSDSLVRFLAVLQILWNIIQISVRHSRHLAISQLEIAVAAFSICAIGIYGLSWEKPKGVQVPYTLLQFSGEIPQTILTKMVKDSADADGGIWDAMSEMATVAIMLGNHDPAEGRLPGVPVPNHYAIKENPIAVAQLLGTLIGSLVFGSIHILAWNFVFPTIIERTLWWAASILCTTLPLLFLGLLALVFLDLGEKVDLLLLPCLLAIVLYIAARLILLVGIFRTLCFLPPSAYVATWATNVPHVA